MCFACQRLGVLNEYPETPEERQDEEEEEQASHGTALPRVQLASKAPKEVTVVRPAPSHDGAAIFAAYSVLEEARHVDVAARRPPFGLVIYDTTPGANPARAERMARVIFERTMKERRRAENDPDRIEVIAFPLLQSSTGPALTDRERAEACIRHYEQERKSRLAMADSEDAKSWFLPERINDEWYAWGIIVIDRLEDRWEEALGYLEKHPEEDSSFPREENALRSPYGSCRMVYWQPREEVWERWEEPVTPESRVHVNRMKLGLLGRGLGADISSQSVSGFYEHFVRDGVLDRELEAAGAR
ncbi:hypothetical protein CMUS01_11022 [Colletotrichum musicola]|uniref:Uncharacterized protein n=1 Tax=Colletotrichum musicola TaxID=2175873 RepID=A0A8H6K196_9PEZI|nr:hypothetical protein CMUS01_11022 [Colletotrichum musicola]